MEVVQALVLGVVQGLAEWLPVSSQGMTSLVMVNFFGQPLSEALVYSLWLHVGTLLAAIVFFRHDLLSLTKTLFSSGQDRSLLRFLFIATAISLSLGGFFYLFVLDRLSVTGNAANAIIGFFLVITGLLTLQRRFVVTKPRVPGDKDSVLAGLGQGFAVFPGISRSGTTTAILLFRRFSGEQALRLSFLMSVPVTFVAIFVLAFEGSFFSWSSLVAVLSSFLVGLVTIGLFLRLARRVRFGFFALILGLLLLLSSLLFI